jgi:endonuclease YncB( thermonuclease family)
MRLRKAVCISVTDGDTFCTPKNIVRLARIDCPETGTYGSVKATNLLKKLILNKTITYKQVGISYGRIVAEVWVGRLNVNNYMRRQGYTP